MLRSDPIWKTVEIMEAVKAATAEEALLEEWAEDREDLADQGRSGRRL